VNVGTQPPTFWFVARLRVSPWPYVKETSLELQIPTFHGASITLKLESLSHRVQAEC
jgi:hypothetical protein